MTWQGGAGPDACGRAPSFAVGRQVLWGTALVAAGSASAAAEPFDRGEHGMKLDRRKNGPPLGVFAQHLCPRAGQSSRHYGSGVASALLPPAHSTPSAFQ